jgi:hypothetical protein
MIVCDLSKVEAVDDGWKIRISRKISGSLGLFKGQTLFGSSEEGLGQLFLSTVKLNPSVNYFRIYLEDIRGSLAGITRIFKEGNINILSGGAFSLGNLWVSEFIVDFKSANAAPEDVVDELESFGGFVASREITELFPRSFELRSTFKISEDRPEELCLLLPFDLSSKIGISMGTDSYAVLKVWPRLKALFIKFYPPKTKLMKISAKIKDIPGSLNALADFLRTQVNLQAIDELHHDAVSGEWMAFGILVLGELSDLREKASSLTTVIGFKAEPLGWEA